MNEAAELHHPFGRIWKSLALHETDVEVLGGVNPSLVDEIWSRAIDQYNTQWY